jgi:hypothetical protein
VRDPGQRAVDLGRFQDRLGICLRAGAGSAALPAGAGSGDAVTAGAGLTAGRVRSMRHEDLLSRLTGRAFKGRQFDDTVPAGRRRTADRRTGPAAGFRVIRGAGRRPDSG